jgi:hypothetical protein
MAQRTSTGIDESGGFIAAASPSGREIVAADMAVALCFEFDGRGKLNGGGEEVETALQTAKMVEQTKEKGAEPRYGFPVAAAPATAILPFTGRWIHPQAVHGVITYCTDIAQYAM